MGLVSMGLCAAVLVSLAAWAAWGYVAAVAALVAALAGMALVLACGWAGAAVGVALLVVSPSVLGESSLVRSLVGGAVIVGAALLTPVTHRAARGALPALAVAVVGVAMVLTSAPVEVGGLYAGLAVAVLLLAPRPRLAAAGLRAVTMIVAALTAGYLLTWAAGFDRLLATLTFDGRRVIDVWAPLAFTGSGTPLWDGAPPRMLLLTGEPGLNVFYLLAAFAYLWHVRRRGARLGLALLFVAAAVVSQSAGLLVALLAGAGAAAFVGLVRRGRVGRAVLLGVVGGAVVVRAALELVDLRAAGSSETVADRGLAGGSLTSASLGNINLIAAVQNDLALGVGLVVALGLLAKVAVGTPAGAFAWTAFAVTATFAQPSQWQAGAWLMLGMVGIASAAAARQTTVTFENETRRSSEASNLPKCR